MKIRGVLFDVDGTLVDTTFVHTLCWWQAFRQAGLDIPMAELHRGVGMGADRLIEHVLDDEQRKTVDSETVTNAHDALYASYWARLRPLPGARDLVRQWHDRGLITVLASSAGKEELNVLKQVLDLDDAVDFATDSSDAEDSKPAPDIVSVALDKAGLKPDEAIFIGDAVWDVKACTKLGLACIGVESGGTSAAELLEAGAIRVFSDAAELLDHSEEILS